MPSVFLQFLFLLFGVVNFFGISVLGSSRPWRTYLQSNVTYLIVWHIISLPCSSFFKAFAFSATCGKVMEQLESSSNSVNCWLSVRLCKNCQLPTNPMISLFSLPFHLPLLKQGENFLPASVRHAGYKPRCGLRIHCFPSYPYPKQSITVKIYCYHLIKNFLKTPISFH